MKSLKELLAIREETLKTMTARSDSEENTKILVAMGTCGIAAGAREVVNAFTEEIARLELKGVTVAQTGCAGTCKQEPVVAVLVPGQKKVTYVNMTEEKVARVVSDHIVNGNVVTEFTADAIAE
ncbi:MAG TPA: ferredoxin [Ruminococcaceae bacterium]|nr:ferredoxin [Oscillospiraceae bacterium]